MFFLLNYLLGQLLRSETEVRPAMMGMVIGIIANTILDTIFIITLNMKVQGAAIATVIGNILSVGFYLFYYLRKNTIINLAFSNMKLKSSVVKEIFVIGLPASLNQLLISLSIIIMNNLAKDYGINTIAALGVAAKITSIATYIYI